MYVAVKFPDHFFYGTKEGQDVDYPPSPGRLFKALVNGMGMRHRNGCGNLRSMRATLERMEQSDPPEIFYPEVNEYEPVKVFAPNPREVFAEVTAERIETYYPRVFVPGPVYFKWADVFSAEDIENLKEIAKYINYFGTSRSLATIEVLDAPPSVKDLKHIVPRQEGEHDLSCYYDGLLEHLDELYDDPGDRKSPALIQPYGPPRLRTQFKKLIRYRIDGSPSILKAGAVANAVREEIKYRNPRLPVTLVGQERMPHVAILPLPSVGYEYSDGTIKGVGIAIPACDDYDRVLQAVSNLQSVKLGDCEHKLTPMTAQNRMTAVAHPAWCRASRTWVSVTPLEVRWRHAKDDILSTRDDIVRECRFAGLPEVEEVIVQDEPWVNGSDRAKNFVSRNRINGKESGFLTHCRITFAEEVRGPVSIGRGRYFGMGLMRPVSERVGAETTEQAQVSVA